MSAWGIGQALSAGADRADRADPLVAEPIEELEVDGVRMVFQNTPNTEAPRKMNTYIPDLKALFMADMILAGMHNIYTLRGAPVRDPLAWSKSLADTLYRFGLEAEVMFVSHNWPRFGNDRIQEVLRGQRDLYANLNNQVLHLANQGVTINQIHNVYEVPKGLQEKWYCRGYHGSPQHNARGVDPALPRLLGLQPRDADPAVAGGLRTALRRDDGRLGQDHRPWAGAPRCGRLPAGLGDREQAGAGRAGERRGQGPSRRHLRAAGLPAGERRACATAS